MQSQIRCTSFALRVHTINVVRFPARSSTAKKQHPQFLSHLQKQRLLHIWRLASVRIPSFYKCKSNITLPTFWEDRQTVCIGIQRRSQLSKSGKVLLVQFKQRIALDSCPIDLMPTTCSPLEMEIAKISWVFLSNISKSFFRSQLKIFEYAQYQDFLKNWKVFLQIWTVLY